MLIGLGVSMLIRSISRGYALLKYRPYPFNLFPSASSIYDALDNSIVWVVILFALLNLTIILFYLIKNRFHFKERFANIEILIYVVFIGVTIMLAICSDIVGEISCQEQPGQPPQGL